MHVIKLRTIEEYYESNNQSKKQHLAWYEETKAAEWKTPKDIKDRYSSASILSDNIVVFNIKGNNYRLVTKLSYKNQTVFIKFIGTHPEYDKWIKKNL
ncbi:MAG: type II toxin-antitoxin system HigB family toxin [Candidatus Delongbacteria bacterium]|nr:type II toxin-antitoxin system HigB family toxin [Candidatus Delongbacteria bacterium]MCG2759956.1 type II toxin-antitoxin system HigB family toxin [Candidatus Delongbacteria bacterium]